MRAIYIVVFSIQIGLTLESVAQSSNQRCISLDEGLEEVYLLDSMLIDPGSIEIVPAQPYQYLSHLQKIVLEEASDGATVCYQVLPINLKKTYQHKSTGLYDSTAAFRPVTYRSPGLERDQILISPNIYTAGSLTRGVSFGNTQNVNVISSFNFQMDGKLTDNLNIRADITDQNVPFQPEGNTQQVREFDNVTLEVYNDNLSLKAGDVLLRNSQSNFLRYFKNVLGGSVDVEYDLSDSTRGKSSLAVAAAKGQFVDITVEAEEGLQGPYQLHGPAGQQFVIVMANSEKVYLDGRLLERGYNHDYVIDYNLGEITFNPNVLITQFSRIRVTFEYSDQNYSRSIIAADQEIELGKFNFNFGFYREKDDINRPLAFLLTDDDKLQMSQASDEQIPVPIASDIETSFNSDLVLYRRKDTLDLGGSIESVFEFSRDSTLTLYQVSFTQVGRGNGDYQLVQNDVNGRVYEWVSPDQGMSQGDYAPVRFVPTPNMKQMAAIGGEVAVSKNLTFFTEMAFSNHDKNLYSNLDSDDDKDLAHKSGLVLSGVQLGFLPNYQLSSYLNYEFDGKDFRPIDRYRSIEFDRDWSYNPEADTFRTSDNIFHSGFSVQKNNRNLVNARYSIRQKETAIDGFQQEYELQKDLGPFHLEGSYFLMENENLREVTYWNRWYAEASFDPLWVVPGYRIQSDQNKVFTPLSDSLLRTVMNYHSHQFYLRSNDSLRTSFRLDHTIREDKNVLEGMLVPYTQTSTSTANLATPQDSNHSLNLTMTYRELKYQEGFDREDENLVLGRLISRNSIFDQHVSSDLNYATSSSREILREFIYIQVPPGEGTHTWRDLNQDGIQDITEFFEAINFDERNYIKVFVPTSEFVEAYNTLFIFTLNATMPRSWLGLGGVRSLLGRLSSRTNININKKNTNDSFDTRFNPFNLDTDDEQLIFARDAIRSTVFFNRSGRGFGMDFTYGVNRGKQLISRGVDSRFGKDIHFNLRYHINSEVSLTTRLGQGEKRNASQFQEDRNFKILSEEISPGIIWQTSSNFRVSTQYSLIRKTNVDSEVDEYSDINQLAFENRWSNGNKNSLNARFIYAVINFEGDENTAAAYELLNALQPGDNVSWQVNYSQKLFSGLQLSLSYDGRKSTTQPIIHMGRAQVTALF
jgi:hypothetical protein